MFATRTNRSHMWSAPRTGEVKATGVRFEQFLVWYKDARGNDKTRVETYRNGRYSVED